MYACVCACSMFACGCVHAGLVAGGSLQLALFRCVRPCALPSRVSGNHDQKCASASGGGFSRLLLWDGWRLSSRAVVMLVRFVSESFPSRPFPSDPLGVRPPEAPWLVRSGPFKDPDADPAGGGVVWLQPSLLKHKRPQPDVAGV